MGKRKNIFLAWTLAASLLLTGISLPGGAEPAVASFGFGTEREYSQSVTAVVSNQSAPSNDWSGFDMSITNNTGGSICDWIVVLGVPSGTANAFKCWNATFVADGDTIYLYPMKTGNNAVIAPGALQADTPGGGFVSTYVDASQITVKAVYYNKGTQSAYDYSSGDTNDNQGSGGNSASSSADTGTNKDLDVEYNFAKLLQESLYFYDANMCGTQVEENCGLSWRGNCHTADSDVSCTVNGKTYRVDVSGGFHDAGDHVKFGLPQGYSATMLALSYYKFKQAYEELGLTAHFKTIMDYFCDYFRRCTVYSDNENRTGDVAAFCYQVGEGNADHGYWGAPENQPGSRPAYWATAANPATDEVCVAIAALTLNYINFGNDDDLRVAEDLFAFAKANNKECATEGAAGFYNSSGWKDDYALAAGALSLATNNGSYKSEYNAVKDGINRGWVLAWDNAGPMASVLMGDWDTVATVTDIYKQKTVLDGVYSCIDGWGSCRYNAALQFTGLMYDKHNSEKYTSWAKSQMEYILGNNPNKRCYVVGYNENASKYPHHRAASRSGGAGEINANHYTLLGALVGGPTELGYYKDDQADYNCNEVALDYNAGLVGAAAGLYCAYKDTEESNYSTRLASEAELASVGVTKFYGSPGGSSPGHGQNPGTETQQPGAGSGSGGDVPSNPEQTGTPGGNTGTPGGDTPSDPGNTGTSGGNTPSGPGNTGTSGGNTPSGSGSTGTAGGSGQTGTGNTGQAGGVSSDGETGGNVNKKKVVLKKKVLRVKKGKKVRIRIKKKAAGDSVKKYRIIGKKKIAKVSRRGVVKGLRRGRTTVKVVMKSGASAKCKIIVK